MRYNRDIDSKLNVLNETVSNKAISRHSSSKSRYSSANSLLGRQRVKREAARVKLKYAEREAEQEKNMTLMKAEKDVAIADAEYAALKEELCDSDNSANISD